MVDTLNLRSELRAAILRQRKALDSDACRHAGDKLLQHLQSWLQNSQTQQNLQVAGFLATAGEIDLAPTLSWLRSEGHSTCLPVIRDAEQGRLLFAPQQEDTELISGRYGIAEPLFCEQDLIDARALDLVLLPLVAFDLNGNRLGMGGGFYDKTFAYRLEQQADPGRQRLIGVAHDFQRQPSIPAQAWDVPLDGAITDQAIYRFT